jgi:hypothetical protein
MNQPIYPSTDFEFEPKTFRLLTEASTLGLRPGQWPTSVKVLSASGEVRHFGIAHTQVVDDEILWVDYTSALGPMTLRVFND